jgi:hypothetical protein
VASPPTGTVTFLFTDIEGSTKLWEDNAPAMQAALTRHDELLRWDLPVWLEQKEMRSGRRSCGEQRRPYTKQRAFQETSTS